MIATEQIYRKFVKAIIVIQTLKKRPRTFPKSTSKYCAKSCVDAHHPEYERLFNRAWLGMKCLPA